MWFWVLGFNLSELLAAALALSHSLNSPISFFNEPLQTQRTQRKRYRTPPTSQHPFLTNHSRHRGHREFRAKSQRSKDAKNRIPSTPKQRFLRSASLSHPLNSPKQRSHTFPQISFLPHAKNLVVLNTCFTNLIGLYVRLD